MNGKILFIPLDERPCTLDMPVNTAVTAGFEVVFPPRELLGRYMQSGDSEGVLEWLNETAGCFRATIINTDMPIYGGLVASRGMETPTETALKRAGRLFEIIRNRRENLGKIYLFSTITRSAPTYTGENLIPAVNRIVEYSAQYYRGLKGSGKARKKAESLKREIPPSMLNEYLRARERNLTVNRMLISHEFSGLYDFLILGMDDSKTAGINILERDLLQEEIRNNNLQDKAMIIPGTDEVSMLMLSRFICEDAGFSPMIHPVYSCEMGRKIVGRYEDRPMEDIVALHITAGGGRIADSSRNADLELFVHVPESAQKEASMQKIHMRTSGKLGAFADEIARGLRNGKKITLADVYYSNGADDRFLSLLSRKISLRDLVGYAGWNTAGNTIGTAMAQGIISLFHGNLSGNRLLITERLVDDWIYQSIVRQELSAMALLKGVSTFNLSEGLEEFERIAKEKMTIHIEKLFPEQISGFRVCFPWGRLFEVALFFEADKSEA